MRLTTPIAIESVATSIPGTVETARRAVSEGRIGAQDAEDVGYVELPVAGEIAPPDMAVAAARAALRLAGRRPESLGLLAHAWTYHQGHDFWSPAHYVAARLGALDALPVGIQQMCNGGATALETAVARLTADRSVSRALVTTADSFRAPGFDRWAGDYGQWYGDGATAALLRRGHDGDRALDLLAITSVAAPELERMHRGEDEFSAAPRAHGTTVDVRRTKKAFLADTGRAEFVDLLRRKTRDVLTTGLAEAGVDPRDPRVRVVAQPRLGRKVLSGVYQEAVTAVTAAPRVDFGARTGHLGAGDVLANLADLVERRLLGPGELAVVLSAGAGFSWSCLVVAAPAAPDDREHRAATSGKASG